ncbi:hypothetical protein PC39_14487 [Salinisphaera sp. PC39]|uniref:hypothetical protein n=1 Tax=Salinisphaera sp. PC39 TaxID=1304156 RepID=UPI00333EAE41
MPTDRHRHWLPFSCGIGYAVLYLYAIGDLAPASPAAWDWRLAPVTLERLLDMRAPFRFEPVAILDAGHAVLLLSPINLLLAAVLAGLMTVNIHGALYLRSHPRACRASRLGLAAGTAPALLAGGACCAPSLVLLLGLPGLGAFAGLFGWLVPLSIAALGLSRIRQRRQGAPSLVRCRGRAVCP